MSNLFNLDGPVLQFINKIVYSVYLNILWFVCCIPVVTIGASTTALFYVTLKMSKNEEGNLTKAFFHSFRENLKQATIIWLILLFLGIVLGIDGYILYHLRFKNIFWTLCTAVFFVTGAAYAIVLMYIFPLLARFDNTVGAMFKNALFIGLRFSVLYRIDGCYLFCHASGCNPHLYSGRHLRGGPLCIALLPSAVQYSGVMRGKDGRTQ